MIDRRDFIKSAAAVAFGSLMAACETTPCPNTMGDVSHQSAGMYPFQDDALASLTLGAVLYPGAANPR